MALRLRHFFILVLVGIAFGAGAQIHLATAQETAPKGNLFGNAFPKSQSTSAGNPTSSGPNTSPAIPAPPSTRLEDAPMDDAEQEQLLKDPVRMQQYLKKMTEAARRVPADNPAAKAQGEFIRGAVGATPPSQAAMDPEAKVVDRIAPDPSVAPSIEASRYLSPQPSTGVVVNAFVPSEPKARFERAIQQLIQIRDEAKVSIGTVVVVGPTNAINFSGVNFEALPLDNLKKQLKNNPKIPDIDFAELTRGLKAATPRETKLLAKAGLTEFTEVGGSEVLERFQITSLPAWVLEVNGVFHIFEGEYEPIEFFDNQGNFIAGGW